MVLKLIVTSMDHVAKDVLYRLVLCLPGSPPALGPRSEKLEVADDWSTAGWKSPSQGWYDVHQLLEHVSQVVKRLPYTNKYTE